MTKITFWNLQRMGAGTDNDRRQAILTTIESLEPDVQLYCELTTASEFPLQQNLTYRRQAVRQLCYAALDKEADITLTRVTPTATAAYRNAGFAGGNNFTKLASRALAYVDVFDGVSVYLFHAPASNDRAQMVMSFIATALDEHPDPWLVLGDFNIEPAELKNVSARGIDIDPLIHNSGNATFARDAKRKEYDYALASRGMNVTVKSDPDCSWFTNKISDHGWISVEF